MHDIRHSKVQENELSSFKGTQNNQDSHNPNTTMKQIT